MAVSRPSVSLMRPVSAENASRNVESAWST
jgi:hypothetical protein